MDDYQKIEILLKEYDSLRTEMHQRFSHRFQFVTIFGALGAFALFTKDSFGVFQIVLLTITAVALFVVWFWLGDLIAGASRRIAQIEQEINSLANATLLSWETAQVKGGLLHWLHPKPFVSQQPHPGDSITSADGEAFGTHEE